MTNYKKRALTTPENYSDYPEIIQFYTASTTNISAIGYGLTVGNSGLRWYDTAVLPNGVITGTAGQTIALPFNKNNLPALKYDIICKVVINNELFVYATSNSIDNIVVTTPVSDKDLYWLDLQTYGSNNTPADFMAFGTTTNSNGGGNQSYINFKTPLAVATSFNITIERFFNNATPTQTTTRVANAPIGATRVIAVPENFYQSTVPFVFDLTSPGHYRISATAISSPLVSMLNYYHYGIT